MRVAFYVRVSSQQQVQDQTIEQQLDRLHTYCTAQGWVWDDSTVFRDAAYSGATLRRPGLDALRDQVARAAFDRVVITAPDRLARKYVHQLVLSEEFTKNGCLLEFLERPMSQDPNDQLLLHIRAAVAEYERTLISERLRRGRQYKYRMGTLVPWTQPPYGYRTKPDAPRDPASIYLEPVEAAVVADIFALYLTTDAGIAGVAKELTRQGIPSPKGLNRWTLGTVRRILANPVYTGTVYAGRLRNRPIGPAHSPLGAVGKRDTTSAPTDPAEWIEVGHVPAIVDATQFAEVQARFVVNKQRARRNNKAHTYLLRALVSCGMCHLACQGQTPKRGYGYYVCGGRAGVAIRCRSERCTARLMPMPQLDAVVWDDVCAILTDPQCATGALARAQNGDWLPHELRARQEMVRKAQQSLTQQGERLTEAYLANIMGIEEYKRRRQELTDRLETYAVHARELQVAAGQHVEVAALAHHIEDFCERMRVGLDNATFAQKRFILEQIIARIVVTNDVVEIRYVLPTTPDSEKVRFLQLRSAYCRTLPQNGGTGVSGCRKTGGFGRGADTPSRVSGPL